MNHEVHEGHFNPDNTHNIIYYLAPAVSHLAARSSSLTFAGMLSKTELAPVG